MSPCRRVAVSPCRRVAVSPCRCLLAWTGAVEAICFAFVPSYCTHAVTTQCAACAEVLSGRLRRRPKARGVEPHQDFVNCLKGSFPAGITCLRREDARELHRLYRNELRGDRQRTCLPACTLRLTTPMVSSQDAGTGHLGDLLHRHERRCNERPLSMTSRGSGGAAPEARGRSENTASSTVTTQPPLGESSSLRWCSTTRRRFARGTRAVWIEEVSCGKVYTSSPLIPGILFTRRRNALPITDLFTGNETNDGCPLPATSMSVSSSPYPIRRRWRRP